MNIVIYSRTIAQKLIPLHTPQPPYRTKTTSNGKHFKKHTTSMHKQKSYNSMLDLTSHQKLKISTTPPQVLTNPLPTYPNIRNPKLRTYCSMYLLGKEGTCATRLILFRRVFCSRVGYSEAVSVLGLYWKGTFVCCVGVVFQLVVDSSQSRLEEIPCLGLRFLYLLSLGTISSNQLPGKLNT